MRLFVNSIRMKPISHDALRLIKEEAPGFLEAVRQASVQNRQPEEDIAILLTLEAFHDDPLLLYACVRYAESQGVALTFTPLSPQNTDEHPIEG
ncbi:MAG: hypothetical protein NT023_03975 [Armatimonadetes bacterium]|nr:hypothetical protein [Armatimonadota bacterium]